MSGCFIAGAGVALVTEYFVVHVANKGISGFRLVQRHSERSIKEPVKPFAKCWEKDTCGQMRSCEEAYYFLEHCQKIKLDNNKNGIPCETLCGKQR
jgi:hypothetical protein